LTRFKTLTVLQGREQNTKLKRALAEVESLTRENEKLKAELATANSEIELLKTQIQGQRASGSTLDVRLAQVERDFYQKGD